MVLTKKLHILICPYGRAANPEIIYVIELRIE